MCVIRNHPYAGHDTWPWDAERMEAATLATMPAPEPGAAMRLAAEPREPPWAPIEKEYRFDMANGPNGGPGR